MIIIIIKSLNSGLSFTIEITHNNRLKLDSFLHKINNSKINYEITFEMQFDKHLVFHTINFVSIELVNWLPLKVFNQHTCSYSFVRLFN